MRFVEGNVGLVLYCICKVEVQSGENCFYYKSHDRELIHFF